MQLFYATRQDKDHITLDSSESAHCVKVLRLVTNDLIHVTDGQGRIYKARITHPDKYACVAKINEVSEISRERSYILHIAIAPTRNIERFEWFLEKATEIGVDRITPLLCHNSERRILKEDRLRKVMISAMKQSLRAWLPEICPFTGFSSFLNQPFTGSRFIATGLAPPGSHLAGLCGNETDCVVLIGPEGDFADNEMEMAERSGFIPVSLGPHRLRTETAGVVACHTINLVNSLR
jgi:16S rRNA (uracil1498-N3)-methyltransferase